RGSGLRAFRRNSGFSCPNYSRDSPIPVDPADGMVSGIGKVEGSIGTELQRVRLSEAGRGRGPAIPRITAQAAAGKGVNQTRSPIHAADPPDAVSYVQVALGPDRNRQRLCNSGRDRRTAVARVPGESSPDIRGNGAVRVHSPDMGPT